MKPDAKVMFPVALGQSLLPHPSDRITSSILENGHDMKKLLDANDPFFAPVWRRWAVTILPLIWAAVEAWFAEPLWAFLFAAAGIYAGIELLIKPRLGK